MSKRIYYILAILSILSLSLTVQTLTPALGIYMSIDDPENDVYYIHVRGYEDYDRTKGDYHDEIDIVKLNITGQFFNLTFAGDIADWVVGPGPYMAALIILHPDLPNLNQEPTYPYYTILYENHSVTGQWDEYLGYHVFFTYVIDENTEQYWNATTGWVSTTALASDIGSASGKSITADVPTSAYTIPNNIDIVAISVRSEFLFLIDETFEYIDFAPNKYDPFAGNGDQIPSYNLFIVVGLLFGTSLIIVKKHIKKK
ncbi:MAG: hypothetical protein ACFE9T_03770 [Promethearchaeota archaeon]